MKTRALGLIFSLALCSNAMGLGQPRYIETENNHRNFVIADRGRATPLHVDEDDYPGVVRAVSDLQTDIKRVTGRLPDVVHETENLGSNIVLIGTLGKSAVIDRLVRENKIDASKIAGKWESFTIQTISHPLPHVERALVIPAATSAEPFMASMISPSKSVCLRGIGGPMCRFVTMTL